MEPYVARSSASRRRPLGDKHSSVHKRRSLRLEPLERRLLFTLQGQFLFPADNPWNQSISQAPVAANSSTLVASIGSSATVHPDFGTVYQGAYIGIPYNVVSGTQPKVNVVVDAYADESDLLPVPIPPGAIIEGDPLASDLNDGDRHLIVYDKDNRIAYELFNVHRPAETSDGQWHADSEAVWDMSRNAFRTPGDTSADAAGLPILPGLVRVDEVLDQGVINHALRFTVPRSNSSYVFPASHQAGVNNASLPRMGERFRLKKSFDISGFSATNRIILQALKDYGMIVADNGSPWYISGAPSSRWNDDDLHQLSSLVGGDFEAVDLHPVVSGLDQTTGPTGGGTIVTVHGRDFSGAAGQLQVFFGTTAVNPSQVSIVSDSLLTAVAPSHSPGTVHITVRTPYGSSATSSGDQFTFTNSSSAIAGRFLFYNQSGTASPVRYDGNNSAINAADDSAIATDKVAYLPGSGAATFANVSSYTKGINGIMVDIAGPHGAISADDFLFKVGNDNAPSSWATAPAPSSISVRAGAGVGGSDRVEITWANGSILKKWLEVITLANTDTGLAQNANLPAGQADAFFFGNAVADSGLGDTATNATVDTTDELDARNHPASVLTNVSITNTRDYNRDAAVDSTDALLARNNATTVGTVTKFINVLSANLAPEAGRNGPFATPRSTAFISSNSSVAMALALITDAPISSNGSVLNNVEMTRVQESSAAAPSRALTATVSVWGSGKRAKPITRSKAADDSGLEDDLLETISIERLAST